jgi:hypothetical protein
LKATEVAEAVCGIVVKPQFRDLSDNPTDFNDLQLAEEEEVVRKIFSEANKRASQLDNFELTEVCDVANCGFNLVGPSSTGKTTCLKVAASIFGNPKYINVWRSTDNALKTLAFKRNDMLLILDEIGLSDANKIGDISYMFSSGQGKHRLDKNCNQRKLREWRLLLLSTGEVDLATHMAEARKVAKVGQEVRLLDIPAKPQASDGEKTYGVFEDIHGFKSGGFDYRKNR